LRRIGGQGAHDDRIVRVEPIVLDDDRRSRLARIGRSACDGPDLPLTIEPTDRRLHWCRRQRVEGVDVLPLEAFLTDLPE